MNRTKRQFIQQSGLASLLISMPPKIWTTGSIVAVAVPAHAMTSSSQACSSFTEEVVDEIIDIAVSATEAIGPVTATRQDESFMLRTMIASSECSANGSLGSSQIEFSGAIDAASQSISGTFNVTQFCGDQLQCEQLATFTANKVGGDLTSIEGDYQGRLIGTLRCCDDLV